MSTTRMPATPTGILMAEHRVIELVLACLEQMALRARDGGTLDAADVATALEFARTFADDCHHAKEERQLFPMLESRGLPARAGPTSVMREEHEIGRRHITAMEAVAAMAAEGPGPDRDAFVRHAFDFVTLLREHIEKEDQILFPMAERMLDQAAQSELLAAFAHAERAAVGDGAFAHWSGVAERLARTYGVEARPVTPMSPGAHGGCGGER